MKRFLSHGLAVLALALVAGCGGGSDDLSTPPSAAKPATSLSYTDPSGSGWRLVKQDGSTSTRIVLGLVGPSGTNSRGVGFNLAAGRGVHFGTFTDGNYAKNTGVFKLKGSNPDYEPFAGTAADPVLFVSRLLTDKLLTTGIFQKDRSWGAKPVTAPVVQVVVELDATPRLSQGQAVELTVPKARIIPADIGGFELSFETIAKAKMEDVVVEVGRLTAQ
jgi:hypothetical protein